MIHRVQRNGGDHLRAAVVGAGAFGRLHASKYKALSNVELIAVADTNADARRHFQIGGGIRAVADWRELLGHVDVVSVCSPASTHATIVRAFLNSGAHVLVEKPIATDVDEADELIALAEQTGKVLTVGHQERFVFARSGLLEFSDTPKEISCWRLGPWTGRGADVSVVLDLMIHDLDLVHRIVPGTISAVASRARTVHSRHADEVSAQLDFAVGTRVRLDASRVAGSRSRGMLAVYDDGVVEVDFISRKVRNTTARSLKPLQFDDPLGASVTAFVAAVRGSSATLVRPEEARLALETAIMIEESADHGVYLDAQRPHALHVAAR